MAATGTIRYPARYSGFTGYLILLCYTASSPARTTSAVETIPLWPFLLTGLAAILGLIAGFLLYRYRATRSSPQHAAIPSFPPSPPTNPATALVREQLALAADWSWQTDTEHRYTHIGEGFQALTGLDPARQTGRCPWQLPGIQAPPDTWAAYRSAAAQHQRLIKICTLNTPDGRTVHFELAGGPIMQGDTLVGYHGIGRDITEHIVTVHALQESQQRYHEVVESVHEVIFRTDPQGQFAFLNSVWQNVSGYPVPQSIGRKLTEFLHPDDRVKAETLLAQSDKKQPSAEFHAELRLRTREGEIRWIQTTSKVMQDAAQNVLGMAGTIEDISSRKIAELTLKNINQDLEERVRQRTTELEASNRELEAFSYSVSHDLRAPLRAIDGFSRILEEDLNNHLDDASRDHLVRIRRATQRMAYLIDDLINLAHLTRQPLHKETFDISAIVFQIIDELRSEEPARTVEIQITHGLMVTADRTLVRVLLENLLRNAWKFSARKPVTSITFKAERQENRRIFCIEDKGAGFNMEFANKLFLPFSRLHTHDEFPGTGIGLATVQRIIHRHNGSLWADGIPGEGARFYFTLGN